MPISAVLSLNWAPTDPISTTIQWRLERLRELAPEFRQVTKTLSQRWIMWSHHLDAKSFSGQERVSLLWNGLLYVLRQAGQCSIGTKKCSSYDRVRAQTPFPKGNLDRNNLWRLVKRRLRDSQDTAGQSIPAAEWKSHAASIFSVPLADGVSVKAISAELKVTSTNIAIDACRAAPLPHRPNLVALVKRIGTSLKGGTSPGPDVSPEFVIEADPEFFHALSIFILEAEANCFFSPEVVMADQVYIHKARVFRKTPRPTTGL